VEVLTSKTLKAVVALNYSDLENFVLMEQKL